MKVCEEWILCPGCEEYFDKPAKNQKYCNSECRKRHKIREGNKKWAESKPRKVDPRLNTRIEMARLFRGNHPFLKRFSAVRG